MKVLQQLQQALAQDVLTRLSLWGASTLGRDVMDLYITLTVASSPPSSMAHLAQRVADDMAHLHHRLGMG